MRWEFSSITSSFSNGDQAREYLSVTMPVGRHTHRHIRETRKKAMRLIHEEKIADLAHRARQALAHCYGHRVRLYGVKESVMRRLATIAAYDAYLEGDDRSAVQLADELLHKVEASWEDLLEDTGPEEEMRAIQQLYRKSIAR